MYGSDNRKCTFSNMKLSSDSISVKANFGPRPLRITVVLGESTVTVIDSFKSHLYKNGKRNIYHRRPLDVSRKLFFELGNHIDRRVSSNQSVHSRIELARRRVRR